MFQKGKKHTVIKLSHNAGNSKPIHNSNYSQLYYNSSHKPCHREQHYHSRKKPTNKTDAVSTIFLQVAVYSLCVSLSDSSGFNHS